MFFAITRRRSPWTLVFVGAALSALSMPAVMGAAPRDKTAAIKSDPPASAVDLFDAMKAHQVSVKFIAKNANEANLIVENKTKQPLNVRLPEAFAGMPVLAQAGGGLAAGGAENQAVGGGGQAPLNIAPEKTRKVAVRTLCLEHGKPEPSARIPYEIKPVDAVTAKPEVVELLKSYGRGSVDVKAAQAAAWHLQNNISWQELATKKIKHLGGIADEPYFTKREIAAGMKLVEAAKDQVKKAQAASQSQNSASNSPSPRSAK